MKLFITLLENVNKSRTSAGRLSLRRCPTKQPPKSIPSRGPDEVSAGCHGEQEGMWIEINEEKYSGAHFKVL
jgi:hypothetical protein